MALLGAPTHLQRVKWPDDPSGRRTLAQLSAELRDGVNDAKAKPGKPPPASVLAWAKLRFEQEMGPVPALDDNELSKGATTSWGKAKASVVGKNKDTTKTEQNLEDEFRAAYKQRETDKVKRGYDREVDAKVRDIVPKELKWGEPFENKDGDLPGDKGAGGYDEYYAKPDAADAPSGGFWGQNRVLLSKSGAWYATADHYKNYVLVTDA